MTHRRDLQASLRDVSIYAYANANVGGRRGRLSKAVGAPIVQQVRLVEQDSEDPGDGEGAELTGTSPIDSSCTSESEPQEYLELPQDIWFAIGDHIPPDGVQTFASICKSTLKVTNSARFWFGLYRRYYSKCDLKSLPDRLKPNAMVRLHGLRACVIRAMFFVYPAFVERVRLRPTGLTQPDLRSLLRRKCISNWYTIVQNGKYWTFWFKLKRIDPRMGRNCSRSTSDHPTLYQISTDISANEEKDCKVLQVSCPHYLPLPAVQGHVLTRAQTTVSQDMMSNKVSLYFSSQLHVVLDPASSVQVLDWWHPHYPHPAHSMSENKKRMSIYKQIEDLQGRGLNDDWFSFV